MVYFFFVFSYLIYLSKLQLIAGQLPSTESLRNVTHCDISSALNIGCGTDELIAIHSVKFAYNVLCETTCCNTYDSSDCFADFDTGRTREFRRVCSGRQTCSVSSIQSTADFCAVGVRPVSYVFLQYYCIPGSRTLAICDTGKTLTSDGPPLYITSANYPDVTIGSTSCACSIETNSCSSSITLYEADIDLYLDTSNCQQNVVFKNGTDSVLTTIGCESYYTEYITSRSINSHYSKIEFNNNSTANQEGLYLLGLEASVDGVSFTLSCSSVPENWCVDCGPAPMVQFGNVTLDGTTTFGSTASVECETGYEPSKTKITCLASGQWETPECNKQAVTTPLDETTKKTTTSTNIVIIIVIAVIVVVVVLTLVQILLVILCHCHLKSIRDFSNVTSASRDAENSVNNSNSSLQHEPMENKTDCQPQLNGTVPEHVGMNFNKHRQLPAINSTKTRAHGDHGDGMAPSHLKQKLPPIPQYPESDHHHFSVQVEHRRPQQQSVIDEARKHGKHVDLVRDKLYISTCLYQRIPEDQKHHNEHSVKFS